MKPVNKEDIDPFEEIIEKVKERKGVKLDNELEVEDLKELVKRFKVAVKKNKPDKIFRPVHTNNFGVPFVLYSAVG